jgi:hypothetical protein
MIEAEPVLGSYDLTYLMPSARLMHLQRWSGEGRPCGYPGKISRTVEITLMNKILLFYQFYSQAPAFPAPHL